MKEETTLKCPKCASNDLTIRELWRNSSISWEQRGGFIERDAGVLEPGDPYRVEVECFNCEHIWKVRGATQITNVMKDE